MVVSVFVDGKAMPWSSGSESSWILGIPGESSHKGASLNEIEVICAYKMISIPQKVDWRNFLIPFSAADVNYFLSQTPFNPALSLTMISMVVQEGGQKDGTIPPSKPRTEAQGHGSRSPPQNATANPEGLPLSMVTCLRTNTSSLLCVGTSSMCCRSALFP